MSTEAMFQERELPYAAPPKERLSGFTGHPYWVNLLAGCIPHADMDELMTLPAALSICLAGPSGCGKRSLAAAFAGSFLAICSSWKFLRIRSRQLKTPDAAVQINAAFQAALQQPSLLWIETGAAPDIWEAAAENLSDLPEDAPLVVLLIEDDPSALQEQWLRNLIFCPIQLPDRNDRIAFFENKKNNLMRRINSRGEKTPSFEWLADTTEGFNYRELKSLILMIRIQLKQKSLNDPEYHGDFERTYDGYEANRFFYTEEMVEEAVIQIRSGRKLFTPKAPASAPAGDPYAALLSLAGHGALTGIDGLSASSAEKTAPDSSVELTFDEYMKSLAEKMGDDLPPNIYTTE